MIKSIRLFVLTALACALALSVYAAGSGKSAPNFTLRSNGGDNVKLSELRGEVVMINFWASWCGPCRQEMPLLDEMYQRYQPMGFTLLGVNVEEDPSKANALLKDLPVSFPVLYDTENEVSKLYDVVAMPSSVLIDRSGNIRYIHKGYKPGDEDKYLDVIRKVIRE